nr:vegetative cell wall protein gp1-like [Aegilops tauschii subsp. strangulata]
MEASGSGESGAAPPSPAGAAAGVPSLPCASPDPRPPSPPPTSPASLPPPPPLEALPRLRWADLAEEDDATPAVSRPSTSLPLVPRSCDADQRGRWLSLPMRRFCLRLAAAFAEPADERCSSTTGLRRGLAGLGRSPTPLLGSGGPVQPGVGALLVAPVRFALSPTSSGAPFGPPRPPGRRSCDGPLLPVPALYRGVWFFGASAPPALCPPAPLADGRAPPRTGDGGGGILQRSGNPTAWCHAPCPGPCPIGP